MNSLGSILIFLGIFLIVVGLLVWGKLGPLGRLPGDIKISRPGFSFYTEPRKPRVLLVGELVLWFSMFAPKEA